MPAVITCIFFRKKWLLAFLLMVSTMLVDVDHLLANPIYDPLRCSIGFHPLHQYVAIAFYLLLCCLPKRPKLRFIGIGLLIHMGLDSFDCFLNQGIWYQ